MEFSDKYASRHKKLHDARSNLLQASNTLDGSPSDNSRQRYQVPTVALLKSKEMIGNTDSALDSLTTRVLRRERSEGLQNQLNYASYPISSNNKRVPDNFTLKKNLHPFGSV